MTLFNAGFTFIGGCFDLVVWYLAEDLELYKEPEPLKDGVSSNHPEQEKEGIIPG